MFSLDELGIKPVVQSYLSLIFHLLDIKDSLELRPDSGTESCQNLTSVPIAGMKLLWRHRTADAPLHEEELYRETRCQQRLSYRAWRAGSRAGGSHWETVNVQAQYKVIVNMNNHYHVLLL